MKWMTVALAGALLVATPAFAQTPGGATLPNTMSGAGSMLKGATPAGCQDLIDKVSSMTGALKGDLKTSALSEITEAKSSLSAGNESACMTHANKAMAMLK